jgi:hypothetical protein
VNSYRFEEPPRRRSRVLFGILIFLLAGAILLSFGVWRGWKAFVRFGVSSDLSDYQQIVTASKLEPQTKQRIVGKIDLIRERARDHSIGFFRWLSYDDSFKAILDDRVITTEESVVLERELSRLEKEFE